jgi:hypothetical protein
MKTVYSAPSLVQNASQQVDGFRIKRTAIADVSTFIFVRQRSVSKDICAGLGLARVHRYRAARRV